jgi:hypothetical protein
MIARRAAALLLATAVLIGSCASSGAAWTTQLSSAEIIAAGSPELRTLDNTGFVYPGGATTEVSQGLGPAVVGRGAYLTAPPTGNLYPLLVPVPVPVPLASRRGAERAERAEPPSSGSDPYEAIERVARALCDHQATCKHIGASGTFESADACSTEERARLGGVVAKTGCETTVRGDLLAECLRAIRAAQCAVDQDAYSMPSPCTEALASCP